MIVFPNAKINIGLNIVSRREDGFHNIETIMYPVGLCDILEVIKEKESKAEITFVKSGIEINSPDNENLVFKAYTAISRNFNIQSVGIHLHKVIPFGAGLGGGSSDGTFMIKVLDNLFNLSADKQKLLEFTSELGSDCPFFVDNTPALATGRGEQLIPVAVNLKGYYLLLVVPNILINTGLAYKGVVPCNPGYSLLESIKEPIEKWKDIIFNGFEENTFKRFPEIAQIKKVLYDKGAVYSSLSGSGSAVYGLFSSKPDIPSEFDRYFVYYEEL